MSNRSTKMKTMIGKEFPCETCDKIYNNKKGIDLHMKVEHKLNKIPSTKHTHECVWCNKNFETKKLIKNHLKKCKYNKY